MNFCKTRHFFSTIIILLIISLNGNAQKIISLQKPGKVKRIRYMIGDQIHVQLKDKTKIRGNITMILDSTFAIDGEYVDLDNINAVLKDRKFFSFVNTLSKTAFVFFGGISTVNAIGNHEEILTEETKVTFATIGAVAVATEFLARRKYRLKRCCSLRILDITMTPLTN